MKNIITATLFFLITATAFSQTLPINCGNNVLFYQTPTVTVTPSCNGGICWTDLKNGSTQLARLIYDGTIIWDANLQSSSVSDTLGAAGVESLSRITVPTTIGTNKIIQLNAVSIIAPNASYTVSQDATTIYPIVIKRISDNQTMCTISQGGIVVWGVSVQNSWLGRLGTTRIKRITLP